MVDSHLNLDCKAAAKIHNAQKDLLIAQSKAADKLADVQFGPFIRGYRVSPIHFAQTLVICAQTWLMGSDSAWSNPAAPRTVRPQLPFSSP
ncbi:hypothetical protein J2790_000441 [Paenarthrobacter nicotinovorans]|nr:hypothetical protein [Paenarthrobacter nicotinovorans]SCZ49453.1 hypothetical protein SAMN02799638_00177 [Arthrobacter sp. UNCCL28]